MNNKGYVLIVALVTIIVLLILSFYPESLNNEKKAASYPTFPCKTLTTGCSGKFLNNDIQIKFPGYIVFLKRFPIEVRVATPGIDKVTVDFQMVGMNMGLNFYQLQQSDSEKSLWTGTGVLPVCTTGRTDWQAIISLHQDNQVNKLAFQFEVNSSTQ